MNPAGAGLAGQWTHCTGRRPIFPVSSYGVVSLMVPASLANTLHYTKSARALQPENSMQRIHGRECSRVFAHTVQARIRTYQERNRKITAPHGERFDVSATRRYHTVYPSQRMRGITMPSFKVAHLREQGQDMIIVPLESAFGNASSEDQHQQIAALQLAARSAGLAGKIVPVWDAGGGRMAFIAPTPWHPFFKSINLAVVAQSINKTLSW